MGSKYNLKKAGITGMVLTCLLPGLPSSQAGEVLPQTETQVTERVHPRTGASYRVITAAPAPEAAYFEGAPRPYSRPDYRMLESDVQRGEIYYDGPVSSRKKVYIFAATVATLGTVGAMSLPTAAAVGSVSGGAGAYAAGGAAVAAGTLGGAVKLTKPAENEDFIQTTKAEVLETSTKTFPESSRQD